jgi:hypothetical protein
MRQKRASKGLLVLALLLASPAVFAQGGALYVNRVVVADRGDVRLGDLVRPSGDLSAGEREALARSIGVLSDKPLFVPVSSYVSDLEAAFGTDAIIVGSRTLLIPKGTPMEQESYTLDRLVDFLQAQNILTDGKQELTLAQNIIKGAPLLDGTPAFQVQKTGRNQSEVSFSLAGSAGSTASGKVLIASVGGDSIAEVKQGTPVNVIFRKGPITIEMPGKAMGSAVTGDSVTVTVVDSQKSFMGVLTDGKAVNVDLP